jgi:hypothetical protein
MDEQLGGLFPSAPPIPIIVQSPVEEIREEIQAAKTVASGHTIYLGDIEMGWVDRLFAWFARNK